MAILSRRCFLHGGLAAATTLATTSASSAEQPKKKKARVAITLDLEMSRHYPRRGMTEWDYQKGNLDAATKEYSLKAGAVAKRMGGKIHYFCVGRVLEQENIEWLKKLYANGHPIGNHTYDHVNVHATKPEQTQFRFQRSPWLVRGKTAAQIVRENIRVCNEALKHRAGIDADGFRTPGGFYQGLTGRPDVQKMLLDLGFKWASSKYPRHLSGEPKKKPTKDVYESIVMAQAAAQPFKYPTGLIEIPMSPISDVTAFRSKFWKLEYFLEAVKLAVQWAIDNRAVFDFLAHPSCLVVEDPDCKIVELICNMVNDAGERAEIVDLHQIYDSVK